MTASWYFGIDPGSSKSWPVFRASWMGGTARPALVESTARVWAIRDLERLAEEIANLSREGASVLVALDAPINSVQSFAPANVVSGSGKHFPFDAHPFTTRPCEKALSGRPKVMSRNLVHQELVKEIGALCGWQGDNRDKHNTAFVSDSARSGVSVLGYMGAPHAPVVRLFLDKLLSMAPVVQSVRAACNPEPGNVYVLESHPAVAMAFWDRYGRFGQSIRVDDYKNCGPGFPALRDAVAALGHQQLGVAPELTNDDELDSFVGLLNLVELATGRGTWFGTDEHGYFLVPRRDPDSTDRSSDFGEVWTRALAATTTPPSCQSNP